MGAPTALVERQGALQLGQLRPAHDALDLAGRARLVVVVGQLQGARERDRAGARHLEHVCLGGRAEHAWGGGRGSNSKSRGCSQTRPSRP
eukprot:13919887-Alexandrium_andersonii.AAC.1